MYIGTYVDGYMVGNELFLCTFQAKSEEFETQVIEHEDFQDVCHKKKVTVVNPISKRLQHTEKEYVFTDTKF